MPARELKNSRRVHSLNPAVRTLIAGVAQLAALISSLITANPWPSVVVGAVLVGMTCRELWGGRIALALCLVTPLATVLVVLSVTAALSWPMNLTLAVVSATVGFATALVRYLHPAPARPMPNMLSLLPWIGSATGGVVTFAALAASNALPAGSRFDWVMRNDSLNNLSFARLAIERQGIALGGGENPAPLPSALVAITAAAGRPAADAPALLEHDLVALAITWAMLIALCCLLAGLVAATLVTRVGAPVWFATAASVIGSASVLSWLVTGYPLQYGFLNTHVTLLVVLIAVLAALEAERAPWPSFTIALACCVLLLATWAPLVVVPASIALVLIIAYRPRLFSLRGVKATIVIAVLMSVVLYVLAVALPVLIVQREALSASGGIYDTGQWTLFWAGALLILAAVAAFRRWRSVEMWSLIGAVAGPWLAVGALLFNGRYLPNPWTYYPIKLAWLALVITVVLGVGVLLAALVRVTRDRRLRIAGLAVVAAACALLVAWTPPIVRPLEQKNPVAFIAEGNVASGNPLLNSYVLDLSAEGRAILWNSGYAPEEWVDVWLMQLAGGDFDSELRELAYASYSDKSVQNLCRVQELMGPGLIVHTRDASLELELEAACPDSTATFVVEEPRTLRG